MREIKFRAWNKEHGEMIFSSREAVFDKREFYPFCFTVGFSHYPLDGWEIMEFTGLLDRHSKEIYEGDMVRAAYIPGGGKGHKLKGVVVWSESHVGWGIEDHDSIYRISGVAMGSVSIIGNIYENPNLLKGGE